VAGGRQAFVLTFVKAGEGGGSVMWLRVEEEASTGDSECSGRGEEEKEEEALPMQGYPSRQLERGARGGLQALRLDAQSRPAALRGCSAGPEAEIDGGLPEAEEVTGGR